MLALISTGGLLGCKSDGNGGGGDAGMAGIVVVPTTGLQTTEQAGPNQTASFQIVLATAPTADVTIAISSSDTTEGTVSPASLTFTSVNWASPQRVTVVGVDDEEQDGDVTYTVTTAPATSTDLTYAGVNAADVTLTNVDNDTAGVRAIDTANLTTNESGGTAKFRVVLNTKPMGNVTVPITSGDVGEVTVDKATLTFTSDNWSSPQEVTLTGVDDGEADGNVEVTISSGGATSTDTRYNGRRFDDVKVTNVDNDSAGFVIEPLTGLETDENGKRATFTVKLITQPTGDVTLPLSAPNEPDDAREVDIDRTSLTFTPVNWASLQTVTVTGRDDNTEDGDQPFIIATGRATSSDARYSGYDPPDVAGTNVDNDKPGLAFLFDNSPRETTEKGGEFRFWAYLRKQPTADVTFPVTIVPLEGQPVEAQTLTPSVTFTPTNWQGPQEILIEGLNDNVPDGNVQYNVVVGPPATSPDPDYATVSRTVTLTNKDDDTAGINLIPDLVGSNTTLVTSESGKLTARFRIELTTRPEAPVTIPVVSTNTAEGTIPVAQVVIQPDAWNAINWIDITSIDDDPDVADGNVEYRIETRMATSADPDYNNMPGSFLRVINNDDDAALILVEGQEDPLVTVEDGREPQWVRISLQTKPTKVVRIPVTVTAPDEAVVNRTMLEFDPANWPFTEEILVSGLPDATQDGRQDYEVTFGPPSDDSADEYKTLTAIINAQSIDIDSPGIVALPTKGLQTDESGGQTKFGISLTKAPTSEVVIPITVLPTAAIGDIPERHEGEITSPTPAVPPSYSESLTFTPTNYSAPQYVFIKGVDDLIADGTQSYSVRVGPATSGDPEYGGRSIPKLAFVNNDNDTAGLKVTLVGPTVVGESDRLLVNEPSSTATFKVELNSQPTHPVTVRFASLDESEGIGPKNGQNPIDYIFIPSGTANPAGNVYFWDDHNVPVIVRSVDDSVIDGPVNFDVRVSTTSSDANYQALAPQTVKVRTDDNDIASLVVTIPNGLTVLENAAGIVPPPTTATQQFTVALSSIPAQDVYVPIISNDITEGVLSADDSTAIEGLPAGQGGINVRITPANWAGVTVTLAAVADQIDDGNQEYDIILGPTTSADANYVGKSSGPHRAITEDADVAGFGTPEIEPPGPVAPVEGAATYAIGLVLKTKPTADVVLPVTVSVGSDQVSLSTGSLTFTDTNWSAPHVVVVSANDDAIDDGDLGFTISFGPVTSQDANYSSPAIVPVPIAISGTAIDNDTASITASLRGYGGGPGPDPSLKLFEEGTSQTLVLKLGSMPTAEIRIPVTLTGRATLQQGTDVGQSLTVTFQPDANWAMERLVTVRGTSNGALDAPGDGTGSNLVTLTLGAPIPPADPVYITKSVTPALFTGTVIDTPRTCRSARTLWSPPLPAAPTPPPTGVYTIDTDLDGPVPAEQVYCDQTTAGGGWTLLAYAGNTLTGGGVPYPGQTNPPTPATPVPPPDAIKCVADPPGDCPDSRGIGVTKDALPGLFAVSTEFGQGQNTLNGMLRDPYAELSAYDFAGYYQYPSLTALTLNYGIVATCEPLTTGRYFNINDTADVETVNLAQALRSPLTGNDYSDISKAYTYSVGTPGAACAVSGSAPVSYLGTWQTPQYGPQALGADGSFVLYIR